MAGTMQILELEIATTIHTNHVKCNGKLQIQDLLSDYGKYCKHKFQALTGSRDINNSTKLTVPYSSDVQHQLELWHC